MRIASNNQWKNDFNNEKWEAMGEDCSAEARVKGLLRAYGEIMPDVLALQEVSLHMTELMAPEMKSLPLADGTVGSYEFISGGDTPLWFRNDRLKLLESGFFRFPKQIKDWEGSFNNGGTKSYTYGVFTDKETQKTIVVASVHLWWKSSRPDSGYYQAKSDEARAWQISLLADRMEAISAQYDAPVIVLGDFNDVMDSPCLKAVLARGWLETHDLSEEAPDETRGHHFCYPSGFSHDENPGTFSEAIDHSIVFGEKKPTVLRFQRHAPLYFDKLSDHFPLYTDIAL